MGQEPGLGAGAGARGRATEPLHLQHAFVEEKEQLAV